MSLHRQNATVGTARGSRWCATVYFAPWDEMKIAFREEIREMCEKGAVKYIIAGEEKCPETGRQHMQVYFETKGTQREAFVRNLFPGSHIELARESKETTTFCPS